MRFGACAIANRPFAQQHLFAEVLTAQPGLRCRASLACRAWGHSRSIRVPSVVAWLPVVVLAAYRS